MFAHARGGPRCLSPPWAGEFGVLRQRRRYKQSPTSHLTVVSSHNLTEYRCWKKQRHRVSLLEKTTPQGVVVGKNNATRCRCGKKQRHRVSLWGETTTRGIVVGRNNDTRYRCGEKQRHKVSLWEETTPQGVVVGKNNAGTSRKWLQGVVGVTGAPSGAGAGACVSGAA
jgi:hypothetical protein